MIPQAGCVQQPAIKTRFQYPERFFILAHTLEAITKRTHKPVYIRLEQRHRTSAGQFLPQIPPQAATWLVLAGINTVPCRHPIFPYGITDSMRRSSNFAIVFLFFIVLPSIFSSRSFLPYSMIRILLMSPFSDMHRHRNNKSFSFLVFL